MLNWLVLEIDPFSYYICYFVFVGDQTNFDNLVSKNITIKIAPYTIYWNEHGGFVKKKLNNVNFYIKYIDFHRFLYIFKIINFVIF